MRALLLLLLIINYTIASAQPANSKWIEGLLEFDFNKSPLISSHFGETSTFPGWHGHSNISDSNGNILIFCNGFYLYNVFGKLIENDEYFLPKKQVNFFGPQDPYNQRSLILPKKNNQYYLFVWGSTDSCFEKSIQVNQYIPDMLAYSIVDMKLNNGFGKVISNLNFVINGDSLSSSQMSAVRHANGNDWWLIKPKLSSNIYHVVYVSSDSVWEKNIQQVDIPDSKVNGRIGQSNFSLDGSLYGIVAFPSAQNGKIRILKFDRCSGILTKYKTIPIPLDTIKYFDTNLGIDTFYLLPIGNGICFSPNNKFVYISGKYEVWQYDMDADEIINIRSENDTIINPCEYTNMYNSIDGRIYVGYSAGNCQTLTYIENPNLKGKACNLCQNCFSKPSDPLHYTCAPPNMPNYSLGALKGSPCDTIGKLQNQTMVVYPNPASNYLQVYFPQAMNSNVELALYDMLGQRVYSWNKTLNSKQEVVLSLPKLSVGLYTLQAEVNGDKYVAKVLIE